MEPCSQAIMRMLQVCDENRGADSQALAKAYSKLKAVQRLTKNQRVTVSNRWRKLRTQADRDKAYRALCLYQIAVNDVDIEKMNLEIAIREQKRLRFINWAAVCKGG